MKQEYKVYNVQVIITLTPVGKEDAKVVYPVHYGIVVTDEMEIPQAVESINYLSGQVNVYGVDFEASHEIDGYSLLDGGVYISDQARKMMSESSLRDMLLATTN